MVGDEAALGTLSLTLDGRTLASFPMAALVARANGTVVSANAAAAEMARALNDGVMPQASTVIAQAAAEKRGLVEVVALPAGSGQKMLEWTVLPLGDGRVLVLARDVTLERNLRNALFESRQRYKDLVEISSDFAWEVGGDGRFVFVSPRGALGYPAEALVGRSPTEFVIERNDGDGPSPFLATHAVEDAEVWMRRADGGAACLIAAAAPLIGSAGEWRGVRGVCRDVTNERARDGALMRASNRERLLTYIVRTIRDVVDPTDMLGAAAEATARALGACGCQILRYSPDDGGFRVAAEFGAPADGAAVVAALHRGDHFEGEIGGLKALATVSRYRHGVNGAICLWRDASQPAWGDDDRLLIDSVATQIGIAIEQIANHERILQLSRTDALTGLFNRRAFFEELERRFQRLQRERRPAALIYVDLDNFKLVNDIHGHQRGDEALLKVRELLLRNTRPIDLVARLGGDEFAIWLEGADEAIATGRCKTLLEAGRVLRAYSGDSEFPLNMSLGVAVFDPGRPETLEELVVRADKAMYKVKREGKADWLMAPPAAAPGEAAG